MGTLVTPASSSGGTRTGQRPVVVVWIDSHDALVARWQHGAGDVEGITSDVPPHHRSTGHVRHDPRIRHGGGRSQASGEPERLEHLARFVGDVAARILDDEDVLVLGPGTVRERLAGRLRHDDAHHRRTREVRSEPSSRLTEPQLVARVRVVNGSDPPRRT